MLQGVIIGFENTSRRVYLEKSVGEIQLCVSVMFSSIGNNFETFSLKVDTSDHSASTLLLTAFLTEWV